MINLKLGLYHHPFLNFPIKKIPKTDPNQPFSLQSSITKEEKKISDPKAPINQQTPNATFQATESEIEIIIIKNMQIDNFTIKLMQFCWAYSKMNSLK